MRKVLEAALFFFLVVLMGMLNVTVKANAKRSEAERELEKSKIEVKLLYEEIAEEERKNQQLSELLRACSETRTVY